jgi:hypothetical protein
MIGGQEVVQRVVSRAIAPLAGCWWRTRDGACGRTMVLGRRRVTIVMLGGDPRASADARAAAIVPRQALDEVAQLDEARVVIVHGVVSDAADLGVRRRAA